MPIIELPDGNKGEFPDNMTSAEIEAVLRKQYPPKEFSVGEMVRNIPSSAVKFGTDLIEPFLSPIQTAKNLGNLAQGTVELAIPGEQGKEAYPRAVGEMFRQRYGGGRAMQTLETDPVGVLGDVSMLMTGGGSAAARLPGVVGRTGQAVARTGAAIDPLNLAANLPMAGLAKTPESLPMGMYESAAKFPTTMTKQEREAITRTALDEQIGLSSKGVTKAQDAIRSIDAQVTGLIQDAQASGKKIPRSQVFKFVNDVRRNLGGFKIESAQDMAKIDEILKGYVQQLDKAKKKDFSPMELQEIKQDLYKRINYDRDLLQAPGIAKEELYKAMAKGAREGIEKVAPEVKDLNAREGRLIEMLSPVQRAANRIENRDLIGIGVPIKGSMGAAAGGGVGAALGVAQGIFDAPAVKSALALKIADLQKKGARSAILNNNVGLSLLRQAAADAQDLNAYLPIGLLGD